MTVVRDTVSALVGATVVRDTVGALVGATVVGEAVVVCVSTKMVGDAVGAPLGGAVVEEEVCAWLGVLFQDIDNEISSPPCSAESSIKQHGTHRVRISSDNALFAVRIPRERRSDVSSSVFADEYYNRKPVIISECEMEKWGATEAEKLSKLLGLVSETDEQAQVLVALDNRNFLKRDLCYERKAPLTSALAAIFSSNIGSVQSAEATEGSIKVRNL